MSRRAKQNCYNCGKPVYGSSEADWDGHVFCCRNCRDAYGRDKEAEEWTNIKENVLLGAATTVAVVAVFVNWPIISTAVVAGGGYLAYRAIRNG